MVRDVDPRYEITEETGYCEYCAELLKLGIYRNMLDPKKPKPDNEEKIYDGYKT